MKKVKIFSLTLLTLFLMFFSFVIFPVKVFAATFDDWYNHISQFEDGVAYGKIATIEAAFKLRIVEEPSHEFDGSYFEFNIVTPLPEDWLYFEPELRSVLINWRDEHYLSVPLVLFLESVYGEDFDGHLYWNFEEQYWQINYYNKSEFNNKEVDMVTDLLDTLAEIGAGIGDLFGRIVESVGQFFYTPGTGDTPGSFTIIGILTIAAVVVSLSMWVLRLILRLFKLRG